MKGANSWNVIDRERLLNLAESLGLKVTFDNPPEKTGVVINGERISFDKALSPLLSPIHATTCFNKENCNCQIWHCHDCDGLFKEDVKDNPKCYFCDSERTSISEGIF